MPHAATAAASPCSDASAESQAQQTRKQRLVEWQRQRELRQQRVAKPPPFRPTTAAPAIGSTATTTRRGSSTATAAAASRSRHFASRPRATSTTLSSGTGSSSIPRLQLAERRRTTMVPPATKRSASVSSNGSTDTANGSEEPQPQPQPQPQADQPCHNTSPSPPAATRNPLPRRSSAPVASHSVEPLGYHIDVQLEQSTPPLRRDEPRDDASVRASVFDDYCDYAASRYERLLIAEARGEPLSPPPPPQQAVKTPASDATSTHSLRSASSESQHSSRSSGDDNAEELQRMVASELFDGHNAADADTGDGSGDESVDSGVENVDDASSSGGSSGSQESVVEHQVAASLSIETLAYESIDSDIAETTVTAETVVEAVATQSRGVLEIDASACDASMVPAASRHDVELAFAAVSTTRVAASVESDDSALLLVTGTTTCAAVTAVETSAALMPTTSLDHHDGSKPSAPTTSGSDSAMQDAAATPKIYDAPATHEQSLSMPSTLEPPHEAPTERAMNLETPKSGKAAAVPDEQPAASHPLHRHWLWSALVMLSTVLVSALAALAAFLLLVSSVSDSTVTPESLLRAAAAKLLALVARANAFAHSVGHRCASWWSHADSAVPESALKVAAHALSTAVASLKTLVTALGDALAACAHTVHMHLSAGMSYATDALDALWDRVLPIAAPSASVLDTTRTQLLEPFDADQRALHAKLEAQLQQQEAWALAELERLKVRRAAHAAATDALLTDTRAVVLDGLRDAQTVAARHIDACSAAISDQLAQSLARELSEYEQRVQHETDEVVATRASLASELAELTEVETERLRAEYERVAADVATQLEQAGHALLDAALSSAEHQVASISERASEQLSDEDAQLLRELDAFTTREAERLAAEQQRALAAVVATAQREAETLELEREHVERLARALADEQQRVVAERERAEAAIAETAQQDAQRLDVARQHAKAAIQAAIDHEHTLIAQQAEGALAALKRAENADLAESDHVAADAAFADEARDVLVQLRDDEQTLRAIVEHVREPPAAAVHVATVVDTGADATLDVDVDAVAAAVAVAFDTPAASEPAESLPIAPSAMAMPRLELMNLALVSVGFLVLALVTAFTLRARRRRWQLQRVARQYRRAESDDVEEVVLFAAVTTVPSALESELDEDTQSDSRSDVDDASEQIAAAEAQAIETDGASASASSDDDDDDSDTAPTEPRERHAVIRRRTRRVTTRRTTIVSERDDAPHSTP